MIAAKLKIDLLHGLIDVEGSEDFVLAVYKDFKEKIGQQNHSQTKPSYEPITHNQPSPPTIKTSTKSISTPQKTKKTNKLALSLVKDLDLSGAGKCERLKDFYTLYSTKTNYEKNLIFVYYLQHKLEITDINVDHVFTCYREISSIKMPGALRQSLIDTSSGKGWFDTSNMDNIKVTVKGMNHIEHDMLKMVNS